MYLPSGLGKINQSETIERVEGFGSLYVESLFFSQLMYILLIAFGQPNISRHRKIESPNYQVGPGSSYKLGEITPISRFLFTPVTHLYGLFLLERTNASPKWMNLKCQIFHRRDIHQPRR